MSVVTNLAEMRKAYGLSQQDIADAIGVTRTTVVAIEQGKRDMTSQELVNLADKLGVELQDLLNQEMPDLEKYREMLIEAVRASTVDKQPLPKTKLAKILYLADFAWFYDHLQPMSGMKYRRLEYGPVPDQYFRIVDELYQEGKINIELLTGGAQKVTLSRTGANTRPQHLRKAELELIKTISDRWRESTTQEIVDFTHSQLPWQICRPNEFIPYELITQEEKANVY